MSELEAFLWVSSAIFWFLATRALLFDRKPEVTLSVGALAIGVLIALVWLSGKALSWVILESLVRALG